MATVAISDDFDLAKITHSGQCFRAKEVEPGVFRFVTLDYVIYIKKIEDGYYDISCGAAEWENIWSKYFDIATDYSEIRKEINAFGANKPFAGYLNAVTEYSAGIRILRQDPFETLISFIISQRKNIPAIQLSIELICQHYGKLIKSTHGEVYGFPHIDDLCKVSAYELSTFSLGYRSAYVRDALERVKGLVVALDDLYTASDENLINELKTIKGVGDKVAACVALYAYHRLSHVPIDVWIKRSIQEDFGGKNVFSAFGPLAGVLQQYIYYYKRVGKKEKLDEM